MEQQDNSKIEQKKFLLPKGPTIAGSVTITLLISAIVFGLSGFKLAEKLAIPCPPQIQCSPCGIEEEGEESETELSYNINENVEEEEKTVEEVTKYDFSLNTISVEYTPDQDNYAGFEICDDVNSICTIYGVEYSRIAKAVLGERFLLQFDKSNVAGCTAAAGTTYCILSGSFYLEPM